LRDLAHALRQAVVFGPARASGAKQHVIQTAAADSARLLPVWRQRPNLGAALIFVGRFTVLLFIHARHQELASRAWRCSGVMEIIGCPAAAQNTPR
jgi:hypothetical protein